MAVTLAEDNKGENIVVLNIGKVSNICEHFVIISAESSKRAQTIAEAIEEGFEKEKIKVLHREGYSEAVWILLDIGDVIIHIFSSDMREFYDLERLWSEAPKVELE